MPKHMEEKSYPPLVTSATEGLYCDETFWLFNYPNASERKEAQAEYEIWREIAHMPDTQEDDE